MAYNNIDQAVTIPVNQELHGFINHLYAQNEHKKLEDARLEKEQLARQDMLSKYVGTQFEDKNYMTGTALDPYFHSQLIDAKTRATDTIRKNPSMSMGDLQFMIKKDMNDIGGSALGIKNARATIDAQAKEFEKYPGLDANAMKQLALTNMIYDVDPNTGARKPKDVSKIDFNKDYLSEAIDQHPELIAHGDLPLRNFTKGYQSADIGGKRKSEYKGVTRLESYTGKVPGYAEAVFGDPKNPTFATGVQLRGEVIPGVKNPDGTPMKVIDKGVYDSYNSDPGSSIVLHKMFKDFNQQLVKAGKQPIDSKSEQGELVKRKLLYDNLNSNGVHSYKPDFEQTNNNLIDKQQLGVPLYRQGMSDTAKLLKENAKLDGLDPSVIMKGLGGDQGALEGASTTEIDGKQYYDLTGSIGGMKTGYDKDHKPVFATGVFVDPVSKSLHVVTDGGEKTYQGKDVRRFIKNVANYNGVTNDKADKILNNYMDQSGNYTGRQDTKNVATLQAAQEVAQFKKKKEVLQKVTDFKDSGDISHIEEIKGKLLKNGSTIENIDTRGGAKQMLGMDPFYIEVKDGTGKKKKVTFKTQEELADYLKENL